MVNAEVAERVDDRIDFTLQAGDAGVGAPVIFGRRPGVLDDFGWIGDTVAGLLQGATVGVEGRAGDLQVGVQFREVCEAFYGGGGCSWVIAARIPSAAAACDTSE